MSKRTCALCSTAIAALCIGLAAPAAVADPLWGLQIGTTAEDWSTGVAVDGDGNSVITGSTTGPLGGTFKGVEDAHVIKITPDGKIVWRRQPGTPQYDEAESIAVDGAGNIFVVGWTEGALAGTNKGGADPFIIKFSPDGGYLWKRQPGTSARDRALGVATDSTGNVFVVGESGENRDMDGWVIKYDADGHQLWKRLQATDASDGAYGVVTDDAGNAYVVGNTAGALGGTKKGDLDLFLIKYSPTGAVLWKRQPGTPTWDATSGIAIDDQGHLYLAGTTEGALVGTNKGGDDVFVIQLDTDGRFLWTRQFGTAVDDGVEGIAGGPGGTVSIAGYTSGSLFAPNQGGEDAWAATYDAAGVRQWVEQTGTAEDDGANSVAVDVDGSVFSYGTTYGPLAGPNQGNTDLFLLKYAPGAAQ